MRAKVKASKLAGMEFGEGKAWKALPTLPCPDSRHPATPGYVSGSLSRGRRQTTSLQVRPVPPGSSVNYDQDMTSRKSVKGNFRTCSKISVLKLAFSEKYSCPVLGALSSGGGPVLPPRDQD